MSEGTVVEFTNLRRDLSGTWFLNRRFYTALAGVGRYHYPLVIGLERLFSQQSKSCTGGEQQECYIIRSGAVEQDCKLPQVIEECA